MASEFKFSVFVFSPQYVLLFMFILFIEGCIFAQVAMSILHRSGCISAQVAVSILHRLESKIGSFSVVTCAKMHRLINEPFTGENEGSYCM